MIDFIREFYAFLRERKKYVFIPVLVMMVLAGLLILGNASVIAPFIYALF